MRLVDVGQGRWIIDIDNRRALLILSGAQRYSSSGRHELEEWITLTAGLHPWLYDYDPALGGRVAGTLIAGDAYQISLDLTTTTLDPAEVAACEYAPLTAATCQQVVDEYQAAWDFFRTHPDNPLGQITAHRNLAELDLLRIHDEDLAAKIRTARQRVVEIEAEHAAVTQRIEVLLDQLT